MAVPFEGIWIIAIFVEGLLFGFSLMMFGETLNAIMRRPLVKVNRIMFIVAIILCVISTTHFAVALKRVIIAFAYPHTGPGESIRQYITDIDRDTITLCATYAAQTLVGDAVVIYRSYIVWQRNLLIAVLPSLFCLGSLASALGGLYWQAQGVHHFNSWFHEKTGSFKKAFYFLTLAANLSATLLLAYRIWRIDRDVSRHFTRVMRSTLHPIMVAAIDAGVLYTFVLVVTIILFIRESDYLFISWHILVPTISITFYLIVIRIANARAEECPPSSANTNQSPLRFSSRGSNPNPISIRVVRGVVADIDDTVDIGRKESINSPSVTTVCVDSLEKSLV